MHQKQPPANVAVFNVLVFNVRVFRTSSAYTAEMAAIENKLVSKYLYGFMVNSR